MSSISHLGVQIPATKGVIGYKALFEPESLATLARGEDKRGRGVEAF